MYFLNQSIKNSKTSLTIKFVLILFSYLHTNMHHQISNSTKNLSSTNSRNNSSNWSQIQVLLKQYNSQNTIHQTWIKIYISLNNILLLSNGHSHQHIFLWNPWIDSQDWYFSEKITKVYSGWLNEFLNISSKEFFRIKIC